MLAPQMAFLDETKEGETLLAPHANVRAWIARMGERPSMKATTWERVAELAQAA
jgi:glutathione S-transferase